MLILFVGDVVAKGGRRAVFAALEELHETHDIDLVVVNAENSAGGFGITQSVIDEFFSHQVDVLTTGNHVWDKREALEFIDNEPRVVRPHNYPVFMHPDLDCPFRAVDDVLKALPNDVKTILVDFHAEASSEKVALGWYLDGRVSAVVGTHTHIPTADERILKEGTAFISDVGMTGSYDSIIGMKIQGSLSRFVTKLPQRMEPATGPATFCGVLIDVDEQSGRARSIVRVRAGQPL